MDGFTADEDCDDSNPLIYPNARYAPDSEEARTLTDTACQTGQPIDANCDMTPEYMCDIAINPIPDFDRDGYTDDDCDEENPLIHPNASYEDGSPEAQRLTDLACMRNEPIDADCDDEPDYFCVIVNPAPEDER